MNLANGKELVFVYGTLKYGEPNHQWFSKEGNYRFLFNGRTKEKFPLIIATKYNIPFLLSSPGRGHNVKGEVYEVDAIVLKNLDILEDHPNFYIRKQYEIENIDIDNPSSFNTIENVWIYMVENFNNELLINQTFYEKYSNNDNHGLKYIEKYLRDSDFNYKKEIDANILRK